jgi:hypothetical protein
MRSQERRHSTLSHRACQSTGTKSDVVCVILMMKMVATMMMMAQWMDAQRQTVYRSSAAQRSAAVGTALRILVASSVNLCAPCANRDKFNPLCSCSPAESLKKETHVRFHSTCKLSAALRDTSSLASSAAAETAPRINARPTSSTRSTCQGRTPLLEATLSRHLRRVRRAGGSLPRRGRADDLQERGAHHHEQEEAEQQRPNRDLVLVPLRRVSTQV